MAIFKKTIDFLFGKEPDIFDDKGRVLHKLPKKKWDDWNNRIIKGQEYNWREHTGSFAGKPKEAKDIKETTEQKN